MARAEPAAALPLDILLGRWTMDNSPAFVALDLASRLFSPYDLNPTGFNPLRDILVEAIDFSSGWRAPRSRSSSPPPTCAPVARASFAMRR
jgi:NTE family protein